MSASPSSPPSAPSASTTSGAIRATIEEPLFNVDSPCLSNPGCPGHGSHPASPVATRISLDKNDLPPLAQVIKDQNVDIRETINELNDALEALGRDEKLLRAERILSAERMARYLLEHSQISVDIGRVVSQYEVTLKARDALRREWLKTCLRRADFGRATNNKENEPPSEKVAVGEENGAKSQ